MSLSDNAVKQCVCVILKIAPHRSKRYFMPCGSGVDITALLMSERVSRVHARCALGHSDAARAVPR